MRLASTGCGARSIPTSRPRCRLVWIRARCRSRGSGKPTVSRPSRPRFAAGAGAAVEGAMRLRRSLRLRRARGQRARGPRMRRQLRLPKPCCRARTTGLSAPGRTATGRPVLASDPHRTHSAPSLRYISHLVAPGLDVIGAGEPFLPGISIGHNEAIAFGLTRFYIDQEDLYVYETNPERPEEYRYKGRWEPMETVSERIEVRGEAPRTVTVAFTRHGPVLLTDPAGHRAFALRAAWLDEGMAPYFGAIEYMRARNWDQFAAAMNRWGAPGENQVYADTSGNIGWIPAGLTVCGRTGTASCRCLATGATSGTATATWTNCPRAFNPSSGYVVTANENTIPARSSGPSQERRLRVERRHARAAARSSSSRRGLRTASKIRRHFNSIPRRCPLQRVVRAADGRDGTGARRRRHISAM